MTTQSETKTVVIYDGLTGLTIEREANKEEIDVIKTFTKEAAANKKAHEAKVAARESALTKLAALGLTADEIEAL